MGDHVNRPVSSDDGKASHSDQDHHKLEDIATLPPCEPQQTVTSMNPQKTSSNLQTTRQRLGLHPTAPVIEEHDEAAHSDLWWPKVRMTLKEPFAEFFGVFILVLFGDGSVAQVLLSTDQRTAPGGDGYGNYQSINWGWGLGVMLGIYVAGDSGAYLKYTESIYPRDSCLRIFC